MVAYTFSKLPTANFNTTPASIARSATGSVYDVGDTGFTTPLNMTLVVGGAVVTTISSDALGFLPDFTLLDRTTCVWKQSGASFETVLTTSDPIPGPAGGPGATGAAGAKGDRGDLATWQATTFYPLNQVIANPSGVLVKVTTAHTSTSTYDATKFADAVPDRLQDTALNATYGLANPTLTVTYNGDGTVASTVENGVTTTFTYNTDLSVNTQTRAGVTKTFTYDANGNVTGAA